jgi:hypothetical protein
MAPSDTNNDGQFHKLVDRSSEVDLQGLEEVLSITRCYENLNQCC